MNHTLPQASTECSERLKALADPTRLEVMRRLLEGACHVGQLNEAIDIDQSLLSHHLKVLREAGLVVAERDGKAVLYSLAEGVKARKRGRDAIDLGCCQLDFHD